MFPSPPGVEYLTTRELADLLRIRERKVYELVASGEVPCSRATGKLLFPRSAIEAWIARKSLGTGPREKVTRPAVFLGSHDPLLEWALRESRCGLATYFDGSLDGLERFAQGDGLAAGLHLYVPDDDDWNTPVARERFAEDAVAMFQFAWRERGLIVAPGKARKIQDINGLRGRRVVPRQATAGSQALLDHLLARTGIEVATLEYIAPARTETDAAIAVLEGKADVAFGLEGLARQYRLGFVPVVRERFDILVDRRSWFDPPMQRLVEFCRSGDFVERARELQGYDVSGFGRVHFNGAG